MQKKKKSFFLSKEKYFKKYFKKDWFILLFPFNYHNLQLCYSHRLSDRRAHTQIVTIDDRSVYGEIFFVLSIFFLTFNLAPVSTIRLRCPDFFTFVRLGSNRSRPVIDELYNSKNSIFDLNEHPGPIDRVWPVWIARLGRDVLKTPKVAVYEFKCND